jgi:hypothetical protein
LFLIQLTCIAFWSADEWQQSSKCAELQKFLPGLFTLTLTLSRYNNLAETDVETLQKFRLVDLKVSLTSVRAKSEHKKLLTKIFHPIQYKSLLIFCLLRKKYEFNAVLRAAQNIIRFYSVADHKENNHWSVERFYSL